MKINNDDLFEIEKIIDIYSGWINDTLNKLCQTAIHYNAIKKDKCPLDDSITSLKRAYDRVREISKKLEDNRNAQKSTMPKKAGHNKG